VGSLTKHQYNAKLTCFKSIHLLCKECCLFYT